MLHVVTTMTAKWRTEHWLYACLPGHGTKFAYIGSPMLSQGLRSCSLRLPAPSPLQPPQLQWRPAPASLACSAAPRHRDQDLQRSSLAPLINVCSNRAAQERILPLQPIPEQTARPLQTATDPALILLAMQTRRSTHRHPQLTATRPALKGGAHLRPAHPTIQRPKTARPLRNPQQKRPLPTATALLGMILWPKHSSQNKLPR